MSYLGEKFRKIGRAFKERIWDPFAKPKFSPRYIALSCAVGIGVGLLPVFGHFAICTGLWAVLKRWSWGRFGLLISFAWTFISNPFTIPFLLYSYYYIGEKILGRQLLGFEEFVHHFESAVGQSSGFWNKVKNGFEFFLTDAGIPALVGFPIIIAVAAPAAYFAAYSIAAFIRKKRRKKYDSKE